jgi:large subunit ribosomal protein L1
MMAKHGKKYRQAVAKVELEKLYEPLPALTLARETSYTTFDGTIEVHVRLGVDPRHAEQQLHRIAAGARYGAAAQWAGEVGARDRLR